jgi:hypothetical protein
MMIAFDAKSLAMKIIINKQTVLPDSEFGIGKTRIAKARRSS